MEFLIVGPGAMGCLFAARLKMAGFGVMLLDRRPERARRITKHGIQVEGVTGRYRVRVPAHLERPPMHPDVVLFCVKSYDTRTAAEMILPWLDPRTMILTLQNGVGNLEVLQEIFGADRVLGGVTAEAATVLGPGRIRHAGRGETLIGPSREPADTAQRLVAAFEEELGHTIIVPEYCDVMGAIGIAIMVKRAAPLHTNFKGCCLLDRKYETRTRIADGCGNRCELHLLYENGRYVGCIGNKCGKCGFDVVPVETKDSFQKKSNGNETYLTREVNYETETASHSVVNRDFWN